MILGDEKKASILIACGRTVKSVTDIEVVNLETRTAEEGCNSEWGER